MFRSIYNFVHRYHKAYLRVALAIIYVWFGVLKPLHLSPANNLATETIPFIPPEQFIWILGIWEIAIGLLFLFPRATPLAVLLFVLHIPGTFLPFLVLPHVATTAPFVPTLEGQYIIKNLALIGMVMTIALDYWKNNFTSTKNS